MLSPSELLNPAISGQGDGKHSVFRTAMGKFLARLVTATGDPTAQVIDLILFLGYFSVCLYAGGIAYETSYNHAFRLQVQASVRDPGVAVGFVTNVLLGHWYWIPALLFVLLFILVVYASRYVWRPWFGYFLLSLMLYSTFLVCGLTGQVAGIRDAENDKLTHATSKPVVKLFGTFDNTNHFENGTYHLLTENEMWFFVFQPQGVQGSVIQVHAIRKSEVVRYEVTVK